MRITIKAEGPLHETPIRSFRQAVSDAMDQTRNYALGVLKARTPVDTGRLRNGWYTQSNRWNQFYWANTTPYSSFVERRVGMSARSVPEIERHMANALSKHIEQDLN